MSKYSDELALRCRNLSEMIVAEGEGPEFEEASKLIKQGAADTATEVAKFLESLPGAKASEWKPSGRLRFSRMFLAERINN